MPPFLRLPARFQEPGVRPVVRPVGSKRGRVRLRVSVSETQRMWSPELKGVVAGKVEVWMASRITCMMGRGDLLSQVAMGQRPEPRQLMPRAVVKGGVRERRRVVRREGRRGEGEGTMVVGG